MLDDIFQPIGREQFFRDYWTTSFLHIPGPSEKFSHLFGWEVLNNALETSRFHDERLKLVKAGETLETSRYLNRHWVDARKLLNELANGATLIFGSCDEVCPPLRRLCMELERLLHVNVCANSYAGWRRDNGFDVHWDRQDTIILQVSGRKHWKIWKPTRMYPFVKDAVDTSAATKPDGAPVWDGVLEQGGLLSIPRGWWHVAYPLDEPCLHVTVTVKNLNGIDMLHWLADKMKRSESARMNVPLMQDATARTEWLKAVRADLDACWNEGLIDEFVAETDAGEVPRPSVSLPFDVSSRTGSQDGGDVYQLASARPLHFSINGENARCRVSGLDFTMSADNAKSLAIFNDFKPHSLGELSTPPDLRLNMVLGTMVMSGVIRRAPRPEGRVEGGAR